MGSQRIDTQLNEGEVTMGSGTGYSPFAGKVTHAGLTDEQEKQIWKTLRAAERCREQHVLGTHHSSACAELQIAAATALERCVTSHYRLVVRLARRFRNRGLAMEDLVQEGHVALLHAVQRYHPDRQARFADFASDWI